MVAQLLLAMHVLDRHSSTEDVIAACRQLFVKSDLYVHSAQSPYTLSETNTVARAIFEYIVTHEDGALREIRFETPHVLVGTAIEYCEYASRFSEDMLYQNYSTKLSSLSIEDLRSALKRFLMAILFRYRFCIEEDRAAFPVSAILNYMHGVEILLSREGREKAISDALWSLLRTLRSLEPRYMKEQEVRDARGEGRDRL